VTRETAIAALVPAPSRLHAVLAQLLSSFEAELAGLVGEFHGASIGDELVAARDGFARLAAKAREGAGVDDPVEVAAIVDALRRPLRGRDRFERLLSVHLGAGFVEDAIAQSVALLAETGGIEPAGQAAFDELLGWEDAQAPLVTALRRLFEEDSTLDDRLAMWGRRIAGDAGVWARGFYGIPASKRADEVVEGAEELLEGFLQEYYAQHSRRMNALALAA